MKKETPLNKEALRKLSEVRGLLEDSRFRAMFGDIPGVIQKLIDAIRITTLSGQYANPDFIDFEKVPTTEGSRHLPGLMHAIMKEKAVRIYYHPFYEDKPYFADVHPYLLKEYRYRWYLIGLNDFRDQVRTYALDRIREIRETDLPFRPRQFTARDYFRNALGVISPEGPPPVIRVAVQKTQAQYMITQPWHETQTIEQEDEEEVIFSFRIHPTYEFRSLLLGSGRDLRVTEPDWLRHELKSELEEMVRNYR